jgi:hypothetical protein
MNIACILALLLPLQISNLKSRNMPKEEEEEEYTQQILNQRNKMFSSEITAYSISGITANLTSMHY